MKRYTNKWSVPQHSVTDSGGWKLYFGSGIKLTVENSKCESNSQINDFFH